MGSRRQRILVRVALVFMVPVLVAACGSAAGGGTGATTPSAPTAIASPESSAVPKSPEELAVAGEQLFVQFGCAACHGTSGQQSVGPALNGVFGSQVPLVDGQTVTADEEYIRESILEPDAKTVEGFSKGIMAGSITSRMGEIKAGDNLDALVEFIKTLQ